MEAVMLNERYRLLERVGSGGMAIVYRGEDELLHRPVAVKVLRDRFVSDPAFLDRFQQEAQSAAKLDHPNIVTIYDVGRDGDQHYIVMEYVDGQDLKTLIRRAGRLEVAEAVDIAIQICDGVGNAHKAGVIHCDIKPHNVLVTSDGRAKVVDFGIARALSEVETSRSETVWGSPLYFSPEQAAGEPLTPASDVYSIGVILYEMLTGSPPFEAEGPDALGLKHLREEPSPVTARNPRVPSKLEWIVHKVLAKEPSARYRSAGQLAHVLREYRDQGKQRTTWQPAVSQDELPESEAAEREPEAAQVTEETSNGLVWMLGIIAFIAVMGLIPLWWLVYRAYSAPPTPPPTVTSAPLITQTPQQTEQTAVPDLVDLPVNEARDKVQEAGLRLEIAEEREAQDADPGVVLEQNPAPGESVSLDSVISIVVSGPGRELSMPDVVGYPLEVVREGLESDGLQVNVKENWSTEKKGQVLAQEPEPETTINAGDPVTLTVSGGVDAPITLEVNLDDKILLKDAEIRQDTFNPGGMIGVTLRWSALRTIGTHYVVFVHLIGPNGQLVAQQDEEPYTPTVAWTPDMEVVDPHQFAIPDDAPIGEYQLRAGMYPRGQPGDRLTVVSEGHTSVELNSILITEIEIER